VNCDAVLGSAYGVLFGIPVSVFALGKDALLAGLVAAPGRPGSPARTRRALLLAGLGAWSLLFTVYMAAVSAWRLKTLCLLCSGMYILSPFVALFAWRLAEARLGAGGPLITRTRAALGAGAMALGLAVIGTVQLAAAPSSLAALLSPAEVRERDPKFYAWYSGLDRVGPLPPARHGKGPENAPITIVEFSDFECIFCAKAFRDLRDLQRQYPGRIRIVFHHYPLDSLCNPHVSGHFHQSACLAAIAAECASRFGKFWQYHDRLFSAQDQLSRPALIASAAALGIDVDAFSACLDDPTSRAAVVADADAGSTLGVESTPTLFINGRAVKGALERGAYDYVLAMELHS
jgi:protein-disulfide isomerase